jgi:hypothetical protein
MDGDSKVLWRVSVLFGNFTPEDALAVDDAKTDGVTLQ